MQLKIYKCCFPQCSTCALCKVIKLGDFCITKITKSTFTTGDNLGAHCKKIAYMKG